MSLIKIALIVATIQTAHAESPSYEAVLPVGAIRKDSTISLKPVDTTSLYFNPAVRNTTTETGFQSLDNNTLYKVKSFSTLDTSSDADDLRALSANDQLVVSKTDLSGADTSCATSESCTLSADIPVYKSGGFNFFNWFLNLFGLGPKPQSLATPVNKKSTPAEAMASAVEQKVEQTNKILGQTKEVLPACAKELPDSLKNDRKFTCGLQQALDAFKKAKAEGKTSKDVFMYNDFSSGGVMGKMYFFNADGSLAQVLDKNPIWVSRGEGGFGKGKGSMKTPDGAIVTKPYNPPRAGNIKDGIELEGLEPGNQDIFGRGVLLHGWEPYAPTQGCLGVAGTLDTMKRGRDTLGDKPPYLDQLKKGLLKDGGVMIYNFTPTKLNQCSI